MSRRVLVVDDEESILRSLRGVLEDEGFEVIVAATGEQALEAVEKEDPDLMLLDVWLPGIDGLETLEKTRRRFPDLPVVMMSGHGTIETAVKATRLGALDFVEKPLNLDKVLLCVDNALRASRLEEENRYWREEVARRYEMVGAGVAMGALREQIRVIAPTRASVLITGENGTGKELVARAIHRASKRKAGPFVEVNCAAIPEELIESELFGHEKGAFTGAAGRRKGKFDLAHGGTLFLDEVGDMSLNTQAKILRVLQEMRFERVGGQRTHDVDVRVLAATNKDLEAEIRAGRFREDLYFRLNVIPCHLPALRERREDIPELVEHFIRRCCAEEKRECVGIETEALAVLQSHPWSGNVRELKNVAERMTILCRGDTIRREDVVAAVDQTAGTSSPAHLWKAVQAYGAGLREARRQFERHFILDQLGKTDWNVAAAALSMRLDKSGLYKKMKELGIEPPGSG
jgi:two-component system nitrogen regulation response regulator NtrX